MTRDERRLLLREVNDRIRQRFGSDDAPFTRLEFLCECGNCSDLYTTTLAHYDEVRAVGYVVAHD
ncbi:MAG TPA: hypothetical protein VI408_08970 [Gaiellaceae bacterium]